MTRRDFVKAGLLWIPTRLIGGTQVIQGPGAKLSVVSGDTLPEAANVVAWWNANSETYADATSIDTTNVWHDRSGSNNMSQATSANRPVFKTNIINGKSVIRFDGTNDFLSLASTITFSASFAWTYYIVESNTSGGGVVSLGGTANGDGFEHNFVNVKKFRALATEGSYTSNSFTQAESVPKLVIAIGDNGSANMESFENLTSQGTGSRMHPVVNCCGQRSGGSFFPGDIAEIVVYSASHNSTQRSNMYNNYFKAKYGLP